MRKAWAFFRRDMIIATSYRTAFLMQLGSILIWVAVCYFIGQAVSFEKFEGNYFEFLLIGMGFLGYHSISLQTFTQSIRESQLMGTLEIVLLTPTSITQLLVYSSLWIYTYVTIRFAALLFFGSMFGLDLSSANFSSTLVVIALAVPAFASLGIASAAFVLVFKKGEQLNMAISTVSLILGGVMFPVAQLPDWVQSVSQLLPLKHALDGLRLALFSGYGVTSLGTQLGALAVFSFLVLPLSLGLFSLAVRGTKASGSLSQY